MESHIKNRVFLPLTPINPYFHPMAGLLELWASWLHAMEWAMESHSKELHGKGLGNGIPYQE